MKRALSVLLFALVVFAHPTLAWNCPAGQIRQQAPAGTPTTAPFYDVVEGIAFICVPANPPTTPTGGNSNANSSATSSATSASNSGATASSTGGKSSSNSAATGGNATGGNGYSGVSASGNSSNTNNNTANGGAGGTGGAGGQASATGGNQKQTQTSTSSASNNGNGANNSTYENTTNVAASKIPVNTAVAPPVVPTAPCFKGFGAGIQTALIGGSFGGGRVDPGCAILEASRLAPNLLARCKIFITDKYVKAAGVTLEDCLAQAEQPPSPVVEAPVSTPPVQAETTYVLPAPQVTINLPAPVLSTPAPVIVNPTPKIVNPPAAKQRHPRKNPCDASKPAVWDNDKLDDLPYTHKS